MPATDKAAISRQDSDRWLVATELMIAAAQEQSFAEPIFHVHYAGLVHTQWSRHPRSTRILERLCIRQSTALSSQAQCRYRRIARVWRNTASTLP
jgi:muramidase (phage lysozyme)